MSNQSLQPHNASLFAEAYRDVARINHLDRVEPDLRYAKTLEEQGELFQVCCKRLGRKVGSVDYDTIRAKTLEEASDVIQCLYSLVEARVDYEELDFDPSGILEYLTDLTASGMSLVDMMDDLQQSVMHIRKITLHPSRVAMPIDAVLAICKDYSITLDEIHTNILETKNPKWEASLEKLKSAL